MTKKQYRKKCQKLFCKAKRLGVKLEFNPRNFHHKRLNCMWYGGTIANIIVSSELIIDISAIGDVIVTLYDENDNELVTSKDKSNSGALFNNMFPYLTTDKQLYQAIDEELLELHSNNWLEYDGYVLDKATNKMELIDLGMAIDNLLDNHILRAIKEVLDSLDKIKDEIIEMAKEEW